MTNEQKYSPLPYTLKQGVGFEYLVNGKGFKILEFRLVDNPKDLVFIVQACNSYYELLEACSKTEEHFLYRRHGIKSDYTDESLLKVIKIAIAKAEEK